MDRKLILLLLLPAFTLVPAVYEVWLLPQKFSFQPGEKAVVTITTSNDFSGDPVDVQKESIEKTAHYFLSGSEDLKAAVKEGAKDHLDITLSREGTHLVAMQSVPVSVKVDAEEFNTYLKDQGLDEAYSQREKTNALGKEGNETYSWYAKLLLQAGKAGDDTYKKIVGTPLEIIPEKNPYMLKTGDFIRFKIVWQGKPLFGAMVKVFIKKNSRTGLQTIYTRQDGMIEVPVSGGGSWMVSVVKMIPSKNAQADWRSFRASLVFGIE